MVDIWEILPCLFCYVSSVVLYHYALCLYYGIMITLCFISLHLLGFYLLYILFQMDITGSIFNSMAYSETNYLLLWRPHTRKEHFFFVLFFRLCSLQGLIHACRAF